MPEQIFFQSSMPRSGSTMLQNIMAQNPDFYTTPTSGLLELLYAARSNYSESPEFKAQDSKLMREAFISFCRAALFGYFEGITESKYVIDKSRGWGIHRPFLEEFYPNPKIICMVRDLRDVLASMEKNFRKSQLKSNPIVNWSQMRGVTVPKRVDEWFAGQPVGLAVQRLFDIIQQGFNNKILFVKYEDLCLYPEVTMRKVYEYLEVEYFEHDFDNIEQATKEDDEVYGVFGDHTIRPTLEMKPSDAKHILGKDVCNWIYDTFKWYFDTFNYKK